MTIVIIAGVCVVLLVLACLVPRLSRHPQKGTDKALSMGQRAGGSAPGKLGEVLKKPFSSSRKATNRSASAGRSGRSKLPL